MAPDLSLTVLVDEAASKDNLFVGEFGLSFFVGSRKKKILFDTGSSGAFLANAAAMGIGLRDLDYVVLSHGHNDHTGGLVPLVRYLAEERIRSGKPGVPELIAHTRCFCPKPKGPLRNTGSPLSESEVRRYFTVNLSDRPVWITEDLVFLGEVPRRFPFERTDPGDRRIVLPGGSVEPDQLRDDSALAFRSAGGLVIITGCSHAGICNITEYAREVCGERRVAGIIGGFHLMTPDHRRIKQTGEYLRDLRPGAIHTCHCTSPAARLALKKYSPVREAGIGMNFRW